MKLLVIEDEKELLLAIEKFMLTDGYKCDTASDFQTASQKIWDFKYDMIVLDIMLPDGNGLKLLDVIKENQGDAGIVIISAKDSLEDKMNGLDLGADDYLTKPFHIAELNARLKALNRRRVSKGQATIEFGEIKILPEERKVYVKTNLLDLTGKEFDLLLFFYANKDRVLTKESIVEHLWGDFIDAYDNLDFIYTHLRNLRKKISEAGAENYIKTVYGVGYQFKID